MCSSSTLEDLAELGLADGSYVNVHSEYDDDDADRVLHGFRLIAYPSARGCVSAYYPEANVLVLLEAAAEGSNTPIFKSVVVRLEPAAPRPDTRTRVPAEQGSGHGVPAAPVPRFAAPVGQWLSVQKLFRRAHLP